MSFNELLNTVSAVTGLVAAYIMIHNHRTNKKSVDNKKTVSKEAVLKNVAGEEKKENQMIAMDFAIGVVLVLCCAGIWGCSHVLAKHIMNATMDPFLAMFSRNIVAASVIMIFVLFIKPFKKRQSIKIPLNTNSIIMVGGRAVASIFYFLALQHISATETIALYKFNSVSAFIIILFLLRDKLPKLSINVIVVVVGILVAIAGAFISAVGGHQSIDSFLKQENYLGFIYIIIAAVSWSVFAVFSEKDEFSSLSKSDLADRQSYLSKILFYSSLPALLIFLFSVNFSEAKTIDLIIGGTEAIKSVIILGVLSGIVGILYFEALKRISPLLVTVIVSFEIVITGILEALFLGLNISVFLIIGAVLIIFGSILVATESNKIRLSK